MRSFEPYLAANRRTEKPVIHVSLNPHPDDVLTDEQLAAIGQEYMEKMGYGNQPYIIYRHEDIGRPHIHISPCASTGKEKKSMIIRSGNALPPFAGSWKGNITCCLPRNRNVVNLCRWLSLITTKGISGTR
ncbi:relaxase/mobilization nuclease domain-containing protein [Bacteroides reticulotermitis]|nr:relaxase/mobilization nuclease domain-containing protein [Bacteroides reticulotermitis]